MIYRYLCIRIIHEYRVRSNKQYLSASLAQLSYLFITGIWEYINECPVKSTLVRKFQSARASLSRKKKFPTEQGFIQRGSQKTLNHTCTTESQLNVPRSARSSARKCGARMKRGKEKKEEWKSFHQQIAGPNTAPKCQRYTQRAHRTSDSRTQRLRTARR